MTAELRVFSFISTTQNKRLTEIGAFKDEKLLETELNKELEAFKALPADTKKIKVAEFQRYLEFKASTKDILPSNTPIWKLSQDEINRHFDTLLLNNSNQYAKK
jgi:hypothetical protein